jgi:hypothetical protein
MTNTSHNTGSPLNVATASSIINTTQPQTLLSASASTSPTNDLWSAHSQPAFDLDFGQFLSPEENKLNGVYDVNALFNSQEQSGLLDLAGDVTFHPLDLNPYIYSTTLASPARVAGDFVNSPDDAWSNEYYNPAVDSFLEVNVKEVVREEENVISERKEKVRRHSCPLCDRKFTRHFNMKTHLKTHDKSRYV